MTVKEKKICRGQTQTWGECSFRARENGFCGRHEAQWEEEQATLSFIYAVQNLEIHFGVRISASDCDSDYEYGCRPTVGVIRGSWSQAYPEREVDA